MTLKKLKEITKYVTVLKDNTLQCELCPNNCIILNNKYGLCNARININGKLYSTVYGYPCSIQIDPIEKKPLYHYYPTEKILSIGTAGCNLFCKGCQNFEIARAKPSINYQLELNIKEKYYSPKEIVDIAIQNNIQLIAYTYNEPTIFFEYMIDIAKIAKENNIKNILVSNGFINPEPLKELCKYIDAANIDIKSINNNFYKEYCHGTINPVLKTIKTLHENNIWLELTTLIIPNLNDANDEISLLCKWIVKNIGKEVPLHFSRFYPYYKLTNISPTSEQKLFEAKNIALSNKIKYVYIGNLSKIENTYCSKCNQLLINRNIVTFTRTNLIKNENKTHTELKHIKQNIKTHNIKCPNCSQILKGVFKK